MIAVGVSARVGPVCLIGERNRNLALTTASVDFYNLADRAIGGGLVGAGTRAVFCIIACGDRGHRADPFTAQRQVWAAHGGFGVKFPATNL